MRSLSLSLPPQVRQAQMLLVVVVVAFEASAWGGATRRSAGSQTAQHTVFSGTHRVTVLYHDIVYMLLTTLRISLQAES